MHKVLSKKNEHLLHFLLNISTQTNMTYCQCTFVEVINEILLIKIEFLKSHR
jgi:hypothetical protein